MKKKLAWPKPKFKRGDKVIVTDQFDMMDRTRAEGQVADIRFNKEGFDVVSYFVECNENSLMTDWYGESNVERIKNEDKYGNEIKKAKKNKAKKKKLSKVGDIMLDMEEQILKMKELFDELSTQITS